MSREHAYVQRHRYFDAFVCPEYNEACYFYICAGFPKILLSPIDRGRLLKLIKWYFFLKQDFLFQCEYCFDEGMRFKGHFLAKEKTDVSPSDSVSPLLDQGRRNLDNISLNIVPEFDYRH